MKMMKKLLALCAVLMLLCGAALAEPAETAESAAVPEDAVLATVNGEKITAADADDAAYLLYSYGYTENYPDYDRAIEYLIQQAVVKDHLEKEGYLTFSEEEEAAFANEANAQWEEMLDQYVSAYLSEDTEEARASLRDQAIAYYEGIGGTLQSVQDELRLNAAVDRMEADLSEGYVPTEEEIQQVFDQYGAQYKEQYENNVPMYEFYTQYYGYESWYIPEGYRSVIHILLDVDADLLKAYTDAQAALDEAESAETPDEAAVAEARAKAEEARAAVIASRQDTIDEIKARLEKGESFQDLIAEYGSDPGMQDAEQLAKGYNVHPESILWDTAFRDAAFQEGMRQPGDVSEPVVGSYGIHILYYLGDVTGGLIMTDSIHDEIAEYLESSKLNAAYNAGYEEWLSQVEVVRDDALIEQMKASAVEDTEAEAENP